MFTFNITMDQLLKLQKDCLKAVRDHASQPENDLFGISFNVRTLRFDEYTIGFEYEDCSLSEIIFPELFVDAMMGHIVSYIGKKFPETHAEADAMMETENAMWSIEGREGQLLMLESGTTWDHNKTGSFLMSHSPFYVRPYEDDKMEIIDKDGNWLLRTSHIIKGEDYENYFSIVTESGHKYGFVSFEAR